MPGWITRPFEVLVAVLRIARRVPAARRQAFAEFERRRVKLNTSTRQLIRAPADVAGDAFGKALDETSALLTRQLHVANDIQILLRDGAVRREPALRAGTAAMLYQIGLRLRKARLRATRLALVDLNDSTPDNEFDEVLRAINGEAADALRDHAALFKNFIRELRTWPMRRDRLARRLVSFVTFRYGGVLADDVGSNDVRQHFDELQYEIDGVQRAARALNREYLTASLEWASEVDDVDDVILVRTLARVSAIVDGTTSQNVQPRAYAGATLIVRMWAIRAMFAELPTWSWSMRWLANVAILQGWIYRFAATAAADEGLTGESARFLRRASDMIAQAQHLIAEVALLERPLKPMITGIGMAGRQKRIAVFGEPPSRVKLLELLDDLRVARFAETQDDGVSIA